MWGILFFGIRNDFTWGCKVLRWSSRQSFKRSHDVFQKMDLAKCLFALLLFAISISGFSQTGPGGVGTNDGSSTLRIWYNTSSGGVVSSGAVIDSLINLAGDKALDMGETGGQRPALVSGALNGHGEISFSGTNRLRTGLTLTPANFIVDRASTFLVTRADNLSQQSVVYTTDPLVGRTRFSNHIPWNGVAYYDIGRCCGAGARIQVGGLSGLTDYSFWSYDAHPSTGKQLYRNGALLQSRLGLPLEKIKLI